MATRESFLTPPRLGLILALIGAIVALLAFVLLPHSTEYAGTFPLRPVSGLHIALGGGEACSPSSPPPCLLTGISRQPFPSSLLWAEPLLALFLAGTASFVFWRQANGREARGCLIAAGGVVLLGLAFVYLCALSISNPLPSSGAAFGAYVLGILLALVGLLTQVA